MRGRSTMSQIPCVYKVPIHLSKRHLRRLYMFESFTVPGPICFLAAGPDRCNHPPYISSAPLKPPPLIDSLFGSCLGAIPVLHISSLFHSLILPALLLRKYQAIKMQFSLLAIVAALSATALSQSLSELPQCAVRFDTQKIASAG